LKRVGPSRCRFTPGIAFYTRVPDQFGPFHTKAIAAAASGAPHVLDGLPRHRTGPPIAEHYTDTDAGAAADQVFGLLHLLGFRFTPRLRDLKNAGSTPSAARRCRTCWRTS
jgi:TnpA family transposase